MITDSMHNHTSFHLDRFLWIFVLQLTWPFSWPYSSDDCSCLVETLSRLIQQRGSAENNTVAFILQSETLPLQFRADYWMTHLTNYFLL